MHRLHIPTEVLVSLAIGADDPYNILTAHGFSERMIDVIVSDPMIQRAVEAKRRELMREGVTFRVKAGIAAEMLLDQVVVSALGEKVPLAVKHDILKTFAKLGALEPKEEKNAVAPTGFTVNISIGGKTLSIGGEKPGFSVDLPPENGQKEALLTIDEVPEPPAFMVKNVAKIPKLTPILEENP